MLNINRLFHELNLMAFNQHQLACFSIIGGGRGTNLSMHLTFDHILAHILYGRKCNPCASFFMMFIAPLTTYSYSSALF